MEHHVLESLGAMPVTSIGRNEILDVLVPVGRTHQETARGLRLRIGTVFAWAEREGFVRAKDNPMRLPAIKLAFARPSPAMKEDAIAPVDSAARALARIRSSSARPTTRLCVEFMVLTAARVGEARLATWDEIDVESQIWTIPPPRSIGHVDQVIPLSPHALALLKTTPASQADNAGLVFPSPTGVAVSDATFSKLFRERGITLKPKELRSLFLDWAEDR